jgi:hypothetical protein
MKRISDPNEHWQECSNCHENGHNKASCENEKVELPSRQKRKRMAEFQYQQQIEAQMAKQIKGN